MTLNLIINQLSRTYYACNKKDWDSYNANPISEKAYKKAKEFFTQLDNLNLLPDNCEYEVNRSGLLEVECYYENFSIVFYFPDDDEIYFVIMSEEDTGDEDYPTKYYSSRELKLTDELIIEDCDTTLKAEIDILKTMNKTEILFYMETI